MYVYDVCMYMMMSGLVLNDEIKYAYILYYIYYDAHF